MAKPARRQAIAKTPRSPRMREVISALRSSAANTLQDKALKNLGVLIKNRVALLGRSYDLNTLTRWDHHIPAYRNDIASLLADRDFQTLTKPVLEAALDLGTTEQCIFSKFGLVNVLRFSNRLVFENPFNGKIESWARPFIAHDVRYHLFPAKPRKKSVFLKGTDHVGISMTAFNRPHGVLLNATKLHLYKKFKSPIGQLAGTALETNFVRIQCDRMKRKIQSDGYRIQLHAYPVSEVEVEQSFAPNKNLFRAL